MYKKYGMNLVLSVLVSAAMVLASACGGSGGGSDSSTTSNGTFSSGGGSAARNAIDAYVNNVIIDILSRLDIEAAAFLAAVEAFVSDPTEVNLSAARSLWISTRIPWEESESALFGPVDFRGFDPALDSWPVNRVDLQGVLDSGIDLTDASVAALDPALKGFHTIEFLLFGTGGSKLATDFTEREMSYLVAATRDLQNVAAGLLSSWVSGIDGSGPYAEEFVSAGQGSSIYPSEESALEEMTRGMVTIADEVANGKIADPFDSRDTELVESQFSYNSITDFTSNIRGIQFAYVRGLSTFVASIDPDLDARVKAEISEAITALGNVPEPFRDAILDSSNDPVIVNAQQQIIDIQEILEAEVLPLIL